MKNILLKSALVLVILAVAAIGLVTFRFQQLSDKKYQLPQFEISSLVAKADVELGKRIYTVRNGCIDCHGANLAGVQIMDNPAMGKIYGSNISPFAVADWSDEDIARAIRYGLHPSGRSLKFMPSFDFAALSKSDTAAVIAYMRGMPAVEKPAPAHEYGPVSRAMSVLGKMPVMFPAESVDMKSGFAEKPEEAPTVEFGKYLAQTCTGCHGKDFAGGAIPGGDPSWPPASDIRFGKDSRWSRASFKNVILTGVSSSGKKLQTPMPVALLQQMNNMELDALWLYLSSLN